MNLPFPQFPPSLTAMKPEELHSKFAAAFNSGNIDAVLAFYEPDTTLVPPPAGPPVTGLTAIRLVLAQFLALKGRMTLETKYCVQSGDLALLRGQWQLTGASPDGKPVILKGNSVEVARRQPDGRWLYGIDHLAGAD
jgi:ketosteroid isomerase-like protein